MPSDSKDKRAVTLKSQINCADSIGRVLLVSDDEVVSQWVNSSLVGLRVESVNRVHGYLMALGQIATAGPPDVVLGRASMLHQPFEDTTRALRCLAPNARLVLLARPEEEAIAQSAVKAGFNAHLLELTGAHQFQDAVGRDGCTNQAAGSMSTELAHTFGDVDLIEQLLRVPTSIHDIAIKVITDNSRIQGIGWAAQPKDVPPGHTVVAVHYEKWAGGHLHAPPAVTAGQLGPWAAWLGRWLAMEQHTNELWHMAMHDELTGMWNRRYFNRFLGDVLAQATRERFHVTLMVFDIDEFKTYNDRYGHAAGDEILREAARLMTCVVREHDVVARIGGDEFGVIFWDAEVRRRPDSHHPHDVVQAATRFQRAICEHRFPTLEDTPATLSISGGLAGFPWDGRTPEELLELADQMALRSKQQGKNAFTFGPGAERVCRLYSNGDRAQ